MSDAFKRHVISIENFLSSFYRFQKLSTVVDHLLASDILSENSEAESKQGCTFFAEERDEISVGVYFAPELVQRLESYSLQKINHSNLSDFLVLTEEISHFHFVLNRFDRQIPVSKTEIEMQGEIDKWLVSAHFLNLQSGKDHAEVLFQLIFNASKIISADVDLYERSSKFAHNALKELKNHKIQDIRDILRELYFACGRDKFEYLAKVG